MANAVSSDRRGLSAGDVARGRAGLGSRVLETWDLLSLILLLLLAGVPATASAAQLLGNSLIASSMDSNVPGQAEAFQFTASASGTLATLMVYVDSNSSAPGLVAGLYSNVNGHPGTLLAQGSIANPAVGAWNAVPIPSTAVTGGTTYWIAILGTGGTLVFRDQCCPGGSLAENSAQTTLTSLPSTWSTGPRWSNGPASLYGGTPPPPPPPPPPPDQAGSWSPLLNWPIVAAHSILMPTNTLLVMDGWMAPNPAYVFDPASAALTAVVNPFGLDIFCSGHTTLADGRAVIVGGHGISGTLGLNVTSVFDPVANTWTAGPKMSFARWYPTVTRLGDGRLVAISGNITLTTWADTPEIYDPVANTWRTIPGISTSQVHEEEYPLSFLLPNAKIFTIASSVAQAYMLDPIAPSWGAVAGKTLFNGSAAMYLPGKILYSGGGTPLDSTSPALATAQVIDLTSTSPAWQATGTMNAARYAHTLTVLPDGKVLAIGGGGDMDQEDLASGELTSEEWDPATGVWTTLASADVPRVYHSTAVLLPDGRVLVTGGGHAENSTTSPGEYNAQYFSPPYLFKGARPTITSAPANATYGSTINVGTPDAASVSSVVLIALAADTHTLDMNQHFVPLSFSRSAGSLGVTVPSSPSLAPPGYYMLFLVNSAGVPSVAPFIQLTASSLPPVVNLTAPPSGQVSGNVTISGTASDPTGIASVRFTVDGSPIGSPITSPPYTTVWNSTTVPNGTHTLGATAINGAGLSGSAAPLGVTVLNAVAGRPVVDAQASIEGAGKQTTPPFSTTVPGDVLVAFATSDGPPSAAQTLTVSGAGLTWSRVKRVNAQGGSTEIWTAAATTTLANVTVSSTQGKGGYDQSLTVVAFRNAKGIGASASASAASGGPIVKVTATAAGSLVYGAGNDYDHAIPRTPGPGQSIVHEWLDTAIGDTYWVQAQNSPTATAGSVVQINDTSPTSDRWNIAAVEIVPQ